MQSTPWIYSRPRAAAREAFRMFLRRNAGHFAPGTNEHGIDIDAGVAHALARQQAIVADRLVVAVGDAGPVALPARTTGADAQRMPRIRTALQQAQSPRQAV